MLDKYNNSSKAFFFGLAQGVARFEQHEGGSPGSPEISFLYELGISDFVRNIADLLYEPSSSQPRKGVVAGYIDDLYWAAPFQRMIKVIKFVMERGPIYGYHLNMKKCIYLMAPTNEYLSRSEMNKRINALMVLGLPTENIKIHPDCQSVVTPSVATKRRTEWGCKILGAFVGTDEYVIHELGSKMNRLEKLTDTLLQYPKVQFRYRLHRFCYDMGYYKEVLRATTTTATTTSS